ncbi:MAG: HD domain-containing protein [Gemmatimonadota bacterium]|nr:HD domain-containing protein [Gemmatimonadota bacterium]
MHPLIEAAGRHGELPSWSCLSATRREHAERVTALIETWNVALEVPELESVRRRAAGMLHDALKDAAPDALRKLVPDDWPDALVHGPAMARRLRGEGVDDEELLLAIEYHSVGHPDFRGLGELLYLADYLDPGRSFESKQRAELRAQMPGGHDDVLRSVARSRIAGRLAADVSVLTTSIQFWNRMVGT